MAEKLVQRYYSGGDVDDRFVQPRFEEFDKVQSVFMFSELLFLGLLRKQANGNLTKEEWDTLLDPLLDAPTTIQLERASQAILNRLNQLTRHPKT